MIRDLEKRSFDCFLLQYTRSNLYLQVVFTSLLLSLGAGVFLGTALLHVLPEVDLFDSNSFVLAGFRFQNLTLKSTF